MQLTSIGDLATSLMTRTRSTALKEAIATLTDELASGQVADITARLGGDFAYLADIDRNLARLEGYSVATTEATLFTEAAQVNLDRFQDLSTRLSADLLSSTPTHIASSLEHNATRARSDLAAAMGALNATVGGRSIFGGINTDRAPLGTADALLTGLSGVIAGLANASDIIAAAEAWFDDPAGFEATMYAGSDTPLAPIQIGAGQQVTMPLRANDDAFRDVLRNFALVALSTDPGLGLDLDTQNALMRTAGDGLLSVQDTVTGHRADLGFAQARIEEASARNEAARTSLDFARARLMSADPFETAIRLEETQFQLESLYAATARTARLSLLNFL